MADPTAIVLTYEGPPDRSEHLEGIPARHLTQADIDALPKDRMGELAAHMILADENPDHEPLYAPVGRQSQRRLRAEAAQQAMQATGGDMPPGGVALAEHGATGHTAGVAVVHDDETIISPAQRGTTESK